MANWRNLSGENNWEGLLEPLNHQLGRHIIHYGEMVEAAYNAHDPNENSRTGCKYDKEVLFSEVGLGKGKAQKKYDITMFIYATASYTPFKDTNWFGYVAVATDEGTRDLGRRDIVVAWRGTKEGSEWTNNMLFLKRVPSKLFGKHNRFISFLLRNLLPSSSSASPKLKVHAGFYKIYTSKNKKSEYCKISAQHQVIQEISRLVNMYANEPISVTVTGHSLGGALAILNAVDIEINVLKDWNYTSPRPRVTAFLFGCPQVGDLGLKNLVEAISQNLHILRIENRPDIVPRLLRGGSESKREIRSCLDKAESDTNNVDLDLGMIKNIRGCASKLRSITGYEDVGQVLLVNTNNSQYLKQEKGIVETIEMAHNMEVYLHGVAGTQGRANESFVEDVEIERSIPLVNKHGDYLDKRFDIPASWWKKVDKANMVQDEDGSWRLPRKRDFVKKVIKKIIPSFH